MNQLLPALALVVALSPPCFPQNDSPAAAISQPTPATPTPTAPAWSPTPVVPTPVTAAPVADSAFQASLPRDLTPWGMFVTANLVVKSVIVGLLLASVATWTVWLAKTIELVMLWRRARTALAALVDAAALADVEARLADGGPVAELVRSAALELGNSLEMAADGIKERVASRLERSEATAGRRIARGTGILATIGSTAPFVGLFGTVWGITNSFIGISQTQITNLAVVAPGIAEALLATTFGLVAAIPAVAIYNGFTRAIAGYRALLADCAAAILRLVGRDLDRRAASFAEAAE
jgi:biopolymer transport protein ExbB